MEKLYKFYNFFRKNLINYNNSFIDNFYLFFHLRNSYNNLLQYNFIDKSYIGLHKIFKQIFPIIIYEHNLKIEYVEYLLFHPFKNYRYCLKNGLTYSILLNIKFRLDFYDDITVSSSNILFSREEETFVASIPMITDNGTFIINGIEKVVVSKFVVSPGVYFLKIKKKNKLLNIVRLIPGIGYNIDFYINSKRLIYLSVKKNKILLTTVLKALGLSVEEILEKFYDFEEIFIFKNNFNLKFVEKFFLNFSIPYDIVDNSDNIIVNKNTIINSNDLQYIKKSKINFIKITKNYLINKVLASDLYYNNLRFASINDKITDQLLDCILKNNIKKFKIIHFTSLNHSSISYSLSKENLNSIKSSILLNKFFISIGFSFLKENLLGYEKGIFNKYYFNIIDICRKKMNLRFNRSILIDFEYLSITDIIDISKILISFMDKFLSVDDMQSLNNLRLFLVGDMVEQIFYKFFFNLKKNINSKIMISKDIFNLKISKIFNFNSLNVNLKNFFNVSEYSQFLDQLNIISELSHKRRITFLGVLGISKKYSGFDVRDLNASYYSRLCPVETPEGINIGLINSLTILSIIDKYGFILAPYYKVLKGKVLNKIKYLDANEEYNSIICDSTIKLLNNLIVNKYIVSRYNEYLINVNSTLIDYIDIRPYQILSVSACLIPFINHNDSNRALMASNMLRQALPSIKPERPLIGTGLEKFIALSSNELIISKCNGIVSYVDSDLIVIKKLINFKNYYYYDYENYFLNNYRISNQQTVIKHRSTVNINDRVSYGDVLADSASTSFGEVALGQNILIAFMSWEGYNFEDSVIVSERLVIEDIYTSLSMSDFNISVYDTENGVEKITPNIYNFNNINLSNLNKFGLINVGSIVNSGDVIVGKVTPINNVDDVYSPQDRLLHAVFNEKIESTKDSSFYLPKGINNGSVINVEIFFSLDYDLSELDKELLEKQIEYILNKKKKKFKFFLSKIKKKLKDFLLKKVISNNIFNIKKNELITFEKLKTLTLSNLLKINLLNFNLNSLFKKFKKKFKLFLKSYKVMINNIKKNKFVKKLPNGIVKIIKVSIISKKKLQVGDKMSGRHGNKGVVSKIVPTYNMPYIGNGRSIDILLNPLGVPSRMNIGQLLEVHLGLASICLGWKISYMLENNYNISTFKDLFCKIYKDNEERVNEIRLFSNSQIRNFAKFLKNGIFFGVYPFEKYDEKYIKYLLDLAFSDSMLDNIEFSNTKTQIYLYDGRTGRKFDNPITVGIMYLSKLNHLVEDKIHARSIGPYSLVTQQPLKGKSNLGGQRLGEMEVWALQAYGVSYSLQEMLTIKSDNIEGRFEVYKNIITGKLKFKSSEPETFKAMIKNINSLAMYIRFK